MGKSVGKKNVMETDTGSMDPVGSPPLGGRNRLLFLGAAVMLLTFAVIPLVFQAMEFRRGVEREEATKQLLQGLALARTGQTEKARALFEAMRASEKPDGTGLTGLAYLRLKQGDRKGAAALWEKALAQDPQHLFALALRQLALEGADPDRVYQVLEGLSRGEHPSGSPAGLPPAEGGRVSPAGP